MKLSTPIKTVTLSLLVSGSVAVTEAQAIGGYTIRPTCELPLECIWTGTQCIPQPNAPIDNCSYRTTMKQCVGNVTLPGDARCGLPLVFFDALQIEP